MILKIRNKFTLSSKSLLACLFVSNKRQNGWTDRAQILCGTSRGPRASLRMIKISKFCVQKFFISVKFWKCAKKYYEIRKLIFFYWTKRRCSVLTGVIPCQVNHLWTACSQILLKFCIQFGIWKKIPEPEDERSETSEAGDMAPESFRYFEISRTASIFQMALTSLFLKIAPKNFQFWIGNHKPVIWR